MKAFPRIAPVSLPEAEDHERLEQLYANALNAHRQQMREVDADAAEKTCVGLLMRLAVQAAVDVCLKDGCAPELEGILDLCRDQFVKIMHEQSRGALN